ncbi:DENN domain-containing protein 1B [Engraulis encrasicolus]|uniref:DENN domain-containing protein 1B n=1 Tax=Engraulis encrasicolus TaxID=184585 RepID=UPI002FD6BB4C
MGSRLRENPERTFYWFFEASCPIARDKDPGLLFQFPDDFGDEEARLSLPRFCFPYDIEKVRETVAVQHFTFVLTDLEGCQRFGFCRLTSSSRTCLCILSYLPWFEVFYKLLNNLADYLTKGQMNEMRELLANLYKHPLPLASSTVTLQLIPYFIAPDPKSLPSIPESRNLTELMVAVDVGNLLQLYASMLFERRILIYCSKLSTLTACVHACSGILFPMYWQHIFIPVLPPHLLDYCCAPMPYLIGVHSSLTERVRSRALEDVVILNVDTNTMETPFDDLKRIPPDVVTALKVRLKKQSASPGCGVARAFLRAQAVLFGGYRDALLYHEEEPISFCEESFLNHKSNVMRHFLESAIHLQFFKQFIDSRLEQLNKGLVPDDLYEEEILQCGASAANNKSYQQWVGNLKKGGGALLLTVKSKAHIYKSAKAHKLKNILSAKGSSDVCRLQRGGSVSGTHRRAQSDCLQNRLPITQHFGRSRPRRPNRRHTDQHGDGSRPAWEEGSSVGEEEALSLSLEHEEDEEEEEEEPESPLLPDPEEMDLLGEIFDTLSAQSSGERGLLYGTRSLDLFGPDTDFISRSSLATPSQESLNQSINRSGSLLSWEEGLEEQEEKEEGPNPADQSESTSTTTANDKQNLKGVLPSHGSAQQLVAKGEGIVGKVDPIKQQSERGAVSDEVREIRIDAMGKKSDTIAQGTTGQTGGTGASPQDSTQGSKAQPGGKGDDTSTSTILLQSSSSNGEKITSPVRTTTSGQQAALDKDPKGEKTPSTIKSSLSHKVTIDQDNNSATIGQETAAKDEDAKGEHTPPSSIKSALEQTSDKVANGKNVRSALAQSTPADKDTKDKDKDKCEPSSSSLSSSSFSSSSSSSYTPRVMSAAARFQVRDLQTSRPQVRGLVEQQVQQVQQPSGGTRSWDNNSRKSSWDSSTTTTATAAGNATTPSPSLNVGNGIGLPSASQNTEPDSAEEAPAPVKVSELKKRFEH